MSVRALRQSPRRRHSHRRWRPPAASAVSLSQAAAELLRFGVAGAGLDPIVSIRHIGNGRSKRVMDKLGLRFEFQTTVPATGQAVAVHAITRREFSVNDDSGTN
jgi:RimJ/RimL family protein N-acetyltransferase